jgi:hypothetical protein
MGFDSFIHPLKIQESIGTLTPKMGVHLGVWKFIPSHSFAVPETRDVTPGLPSWPATLQALALITSPRLELRQTCKTHRGLNAKEATTFPLIVFFVPSHGACTQMSFCPKTPKLEVPKMGLVRLWRPITSCVNLQLRWSPKQNCSIHRELSNDMWHVTYT